MLLLCDSILQTITIKFFDIKDWSTLQEMTLFSKCIYLKFFSDLNNRQIFLRNVETCNSFFKPC